MVSDKEGHKPRKWWIMIPWTTTNMSVYWTGLWFVVFMNSRHFYVGETNEFHSPCESCGNSHIWAQRHLNAFSFHFWLTPPLCMTGLSLLRSVTLYHSSNMSWKWTNAFWTPSHFTGTMLWARGELRRPSELTFIMQQIEWLAYLGLGQPKRVNTGYLAVGHCYHEIHGITNYLRYNIMISRCLMVAW